MLFDPTCKAYVPNAIDYIMNGLFQANDNSLPSGLNYYTFEDQSKVVFATDYLSNLIYDDWDDNNFNTLGNIFTANYWEGYVNTEKKYPIDYESAFEEIPNIQELNFVPEYIILIEKLLEGYNYSFIVFNKGLLCLHLVNVN
jgi:hypothetical protein